MHIKSAEYIGSAVKQWQYPRSELPEIAFAGRSNVGKSSLINKLVNRKNLVHTSRTPGRTQTINFFLINKQLVFVDLPGYGYAKVPKKIQRQWGPMVENYLSRRKNLELVVLILDIRRIPSKGDQGLISWLLEKNIPYHVVLTKIDKLKPQNRKKQQKIIASLLEISHDKLFLFSAKTGEGKEELWKYIKNYSRI